MKVNLRYIFFVIIAILISHFSWAQCDAKIGLEPGSSTVGCGYPLAIHFNSKASINVQDMEWDFGDATTSTANSPLHEFYYDAVQQKDKTYKVVLTVNCLNSDTDKDSIYVTAQNVPRASFSSNKTKACQLSEEVCFTNSSDYDPTYTYNWIFDVGETSTEFDPCHKFSLAGYRTPRLTVSTPQGCSKEVSLSHSIQIVAVPTPTFTATPTTGCNPMYVTVQNQTDPLDIQQIKWYWGDGDVSYSLNPPTHLYNVADTFRIKLEIVNINGCVNTSDVLINNKVQPVVKLAPADPSICIDEKTKFEHIGLSYPGANYNWGFDSPGSISGSGEGPFDISWKEAGLKTVSLSINLNGCVGTRSVYTFVEPADMVHLLDVTPSATNCEGDELKFIASPSYHNSYSFSVNGGNVQTSDTNVFTSKFLSPNDVINVSAIDRNNCATITMTDPITANITPTPVVTISRLPAGDSVCVNEVVQLTASPLGLDSYKFYDGNIPLGNAAANISEPLDSVTNNVLRVVASMNGCENNTTNPLSKTRLIVVDSLETPRLNCGKSTGGSVSFVWDTIKGAVDYEISINGGVFENTTADYSHEIAVGADSTLFAFIRAKGINPCGDSYASTDTIRCTSTPCSAISFTKSLDKFLCEGQSTTLSIKDISISNYEIYWNNIEVNAVNRLTVTPAESTEYFVAVKNMDELSCPLVTKSIQVKVQKKPVITLDNSIASDSICEETPISYIANPSIYDWYKFYDNYELVQEGNSPVYTTNALRDKHEIYAIATENSCGGEVSNSVIKRVLKRLPQTQIECGTTNSNSVNFDWDYVAGAVGYEVSIDSLGGVPNFVDVGNTRTFLMNGLDAGESVTITVRPYGNEPCVDCYEYVSATCFAESCTPISFRKSNDIHICEGQTASMFIRDISVPYYLVSWNNEPYTYDTTFSIKLLSDTTIMVKVKDALRPQCNASKNYFNIDVDYKPPVTINTSTGSDSVCSENGVTFVAEPGGYDRYVFYDNWKVVQDGPEPFYYTTDYRHLHYLKVAAVDKGCANFLGDSIQKPVTTRLEAPQVNCGLTTTNSIEFVWDSIPNAKGYIVSVNDNSFVESSGKFSHDVFTNPATEVTLEVIALNSGPCGNSVSSTVWSGLPTTCKTQACAPIDFTRPVHRDLCAGDSAHLQISNLTSINYTTAWNFEPAGTALEYHYLPLKSDTVPIVYKDLNQMGCPPAIKYTIVNRRQVPIPNMGFYDDTICSGASAILLAANPGYDNYKFFSNDLLIADTPSYRVEVPNIDMDSSFRLEIYHYGCFASSEPDTVYAIPIESVYLQTSAVTSQVCENASLAVNLFGNGYVHYEFWNRDSLLQDDASDTYRIDRIYLSDTIRIDSIYAYGISDQGCRSLASNAIEHEVLEKTNVDLSINKSQICLWDTVSLQALPDDLPSYSFIDHGVEFRQSNSAYILTNVIGVINDVRVLGTNALGCVSDTSDAISLEVKPIANPQIVTSDTVVCVGDSIYMEALLEAGYATAVVYWSNGDQGRTASFVPTISQDLLAFTMYDGCKSLVDTLPLVVDLNKPNIKRVEPITVCINEDLVLPGNGGDNYVWSPADSVSDASIQEPLYFTRESQTFSYTVTNVACTDSAKIDVIVDLCLTELPELIPQIITPNNDGVNDFWDILHIDYFAENTLFMYNRWGSVVYEAAPYLNEWYGETNDGKELPNGTYFYVLNLGPEFPTYTGYVIINK